MRRTPSSFFPLIKSGHLLFYFNRNWKEIDWIFPMVVKGLIDIHDGSSKNRLLDYFISLKSWWYRTDFRAEKVFMPTRLSVRVFFKIFSICRKRKSNEALMEWLKCRSRIGNIVGRQDHSAITSRRVHSLFSVVSHFTSRSVINGQYLARFRPSHTIIENQG